MTENILIIDDDSMMYDVISRVLKTSDGISKSAKFFHASTLKEAKNILSSENINMVFTDYAIKGFDETGEDVLNYINEHNIKVKVLVTTGIVDSDLHTKLKSLGACNVLRKPFNPKSLINNYKTYKQ